MTNKVIVLGSLNIDTTMHVGRLPLPGETLKMSDLSTSGGGKGANQAISAARSGASTSFIGSVGNDFQGQQMKEILKNEGINIENIVESTEGTGQAFILLQESGENSILIYGGANQTIDEESLTQATPMIDDAQFIIAQFETPLEITQKAFELAKKSGTKTILNPAPAQSIVSELMQTVDLIIPNETEAEILTGIKVVDEESCLKASEELIGKGAKNVIITLGSKGAFYYLESKEYGLIPAFKVNAVDTTAAGDTFIGALCSQLELDFSNIKDAIKYASKASSIAVQRFGAIPSIPTSDEIK